MTTTLYHRTAARAAGICLLACASACVPLPGAAQGHPTGDEYQIRISQIIPLTWPNFDIYYSIRDKEGNPLAPGERIKLERELAKNPTKKVKALPESVVRDNSDPEQAAPIYSVLVVDVSDSMREPTSDGKQKMAAVRQGVSLFKDMMRPQDYCALIPFGSKVPKVEDIVFYKKDDPGWAARINALNFHYDVTRLYDAVDVTLDFLKSLEKKNLKARTPVVLLTDGTNNIRTERGDMVGRLEGDEGWKTVREKAEQLKVRFDTIGIGKRGTTKPNASGPHDNNYYKELANYLDEDALKGLAGVNREASEVVEHFLVTPSAKEMTAQYQKLMVEYQQEQVIHCYGHPDLNQDADPGIFLEMAVGDKKYASNEVQIAYLVPSIPGMRDPHYGEFVTRRVTIFASLFVPLLLLWFVPRFVSKAFVLPQGSEDPRRTAAQRQNPGGRATAVAANYWTNQMAQTGGPTPPGMAPVPGAMPAQPTPLYTMPVAHPGMPAQPMGAMGQQTIPVTPPPTNPGMGTIPFPGMAQPPVGNGGPMPPGSPAWGPASPQPPVPPQPQIYPVYPQQQPVQAVVPQAFPQAAPGQPVMPQPYPQGMPGQPVMPQPFQQAVPGQPYMPVPQPVQPYAPVPQPAPQPQAYTPYPQAPLPAQPGAPATIPGAGLNPQPPPAQAVVYNPVVNNPSGHVPAHSAYPPAPPISGVSSPPPGGTTIPVHVEEVVPYLEEDRLRGNTLQGPGAPSP